MDIAENFSTRCSHGVPLIDGDECNDCIELEVVKMQVLKTCEHLMLAYTPPEASATRALVLTACGKYVSMKLHKPAQAIPVVRTLATQIIDTFKLDPGESPLDASELLMGQQLLLTELSYEVDAAELAKLEAQEANK